MKKEKKKTIALFLIIPLFLLLAFSVIPFFNVIYSSFFSMSYTKKLGFVGLANYLEILRNSHYNRAITVSLYYITAAFFQVSIALFSSFLLMKCRFTAFYKAIITIPYMVNGIAVGYLFKLFFTHGFILDSLLGWLGANMDSLPYWLRDQHINNWVLAFASVWRYTGLSLVVFIGAISSIEGAVFEASFLDGANRWQQFRFIVWPGIRSTVLLNLLLSVTSSLSEFEIPYAIASGGANGTATYMTLIYRIAFTERKVGLASAMVVLLLFQIILLSALLIHLSKTIHGSRLEESENI